MATKEPLVCYTGEVWYLCGREVTEYKLKKLCQRGLVECTIDQFGRKVYKIPEKSYPRVWREIMLIHFVSNKDYMDKVKEASKKAEKGDSKDLEKIELQLALALKTPEELKEWLIEIFSEMEGISKEELRDVAKKLEERMKKDRELIYV